MNALNWRVDYVKKEINKHIFYILSYRIGRFMIKIQKEIHELKGIVFINPDRKKDIIGETSKYADKLRGFAS